MSEAHVYKRLARARGRLRELPGPRDELADGVLSSRLAAVQTILYLMFTEGYLSSRADSAIRRELCDEAKRLARLLAEHPLGATPESFALLALMHLHAARAKGRQDEAGGLLLLEEQDRELWDREEIAVGLSWLARSAQGDALSRYHAEAGIAAEHALAPSLAATRWDRIVECYQQLERLAPSGIHRLGHAMALAQAHGPSEGLALLAGFVPSPPVAESYLWFATLADLHRRCGHVEDAGRYRALAVEATPSAAIRAALLRRLR